jgi:hypothetical protein
MLFHETAVASVSESAKNPEERHDGIGFIHILGDLDCMFNPAIPASPGFYDAHSLRRP